MIKYQKKMKKHSLVNGFSLHHLSGSPPASVL